MLIILWYILDDQIQVFDYNFQFLNICCTLAVQLYEEERLKRLQYIVDFFRYLLAPVRLLQNLTALSQNWIHVYWHVKMLWILWNCVQIEHRRISSMFTLYECERTRWCSFCTQFYYYRYLICISFSLTYRGAEKAHFRFSVTSDY